MKTKILLLPLILLLAISADVHADTGTTSDGFVWSSDGVTVTITSYAGSGGAVNIPATINSLPVTSIGDYAFQNLAGLTGVTIPASVASIGNGAFLSCSMLILAEFLGNAPAMGLDVFYGATSGFTVEYHAGTTGFTSPTWQGYPSVSSDSLTRVIGLSGNLTFGNVTVNATKTSTMVISNTGSDTLTVSGIAYPSGYSGNWRSGTIAAGGTQNVAVTFRPTAVQGYNGTITVSSDATSGSGAVAVSGAGIAASTRVIGVSGNLTFGSVTVNTTKTLTMRVANTGNATLTVSGIGYPAGFSGNWTSGTITAGGNRTVAVTFSPTAGQGYNGTVTVSSDATSGNGTIAASGTGIGAPTRVIGLSGNLAFGNVTVNATKTSAMVIANTGSAALTVSGIAYPAGFSGNWTGGTIAAGGNQTVAVTFAPAAAQGYNGTITVSSDMTGGTNTAPVSGTGVAVFSPYASWQATKFSPADIGAGLSAPAVDFDHDGMANILEYAFGKDPKTADFPDVVSTVSGSNLQVSFPCDAACTDITYIVQTSPDLATWTDIATSAGGAATLPVGVLSVVDDTGTGARTVTVTDSAMLPTNAQRFLRVKVTSP